jgi:N-methylhydantoinase B
VSVGAAKAAYGVVIREDAVDAAATDALRASRRRDDETPHFAYGPEREAHEAVWTADAYDQLTRLLAMLPVHWRFFVKTKMFEAMAENVQDVSRVFATVREAYPEIPEVS